MTDVFGLVQTCMGHLNGLFDPCDGPRHTQLLDTEWVMLYAPTAAAEDHLQVEGPSMRCVELDHEMYDSLLRTATGQILCHSRCINVRKATSGGTPD